MLPVLDLQPGIEATSSARALSQWRGVPGPKDANGLRAANVSWAMAEACSSGRHSSGGNWGRVIGAFTDHPPIPD